MGYADDEHASSDTAVSNLRPGPGLEDQQAVRMSDMEDGNASGRFRIVRSVSNGGDPLKRSRSREVASKLKERLSLSPESRERRKVASDHRETRREVPVAVVEQRVSNLAQGSLCLILMTAPFEHVLGLIPKGVLAGLFWYMGTDALLASGVTAKMLHLIRDPRAISPTDPLRKVRRSRIALFTLVELIGFGATFAITQTIAAIGFPIIIMLLVPLRVFVVPKLGFTAEELSILDGPVASPFVSAVARLRLRSS